MLRRLLGWILGSDVEWRQMSRHWCLRQHVSARVDYHGRTVDWSALRRGK